MKSSPRLSSEAFVYFFAAGLVGAAAIPVSAAEPEFETINDEKIRVQFEKGLEDLRAFDTGTSTEDLSKQLKERRAFELKLPPPERGVRLSAPEIYSRARKATLVFGHNFQCDKCTKWHAGLAGAVVIDPSGIVVTNYHVMDKPDAGAFGAMNADGEMFPVVEVLAASSRDDLAIVRLSGGPFEAVPLSTGDRVGSEIKVISHPDGRFYSFSEGAIARYYLEAKKKSPRLQITADYARGSSGCGVYNESGELTGVVASTDSIYYTETGEEQKNLQMVVKSCVPAATIRRLISGGDQED